MTAAKTDQAFQLDTSGGVGVMPGWEAPVPTSNRFIFWAGLNPFTQGYIEAMLWAPLIQGDDEDGLYWTPRFSDLSPDALTKIIADCEACLDRFKPPHPDAELGAAFWSGRNHTGSGNEFHPHFLPLTVALDGAGKVVFS